MESLAVLDEVTSLNFCPLINYFLRKLYNKA